MFLGIFRIRSPLDSRDSYEDARQRARGGVPQDTLERASTRRGGKERLAPRREMVAKRVRFAFAGASSRNGHETDGAVAIYGTRRRRGAARAAAAPVAVHVERHDGANRRDVMSKRRDATRRFVRARRVPNRRRAVDAAREERSPARVRDARHLADVRARHDVRGEPRAERYALDSKVPGIVPGHERRDRFQRRRGRRESRRRVVRDGEERRRGRGDGIRTGARGDIVEMAPSARHVQNRGQRRVLRAAVISDAKERDASVR